jgi:hypothetical protein
MLREGLHEYRGISVQQVHLGLAVSGAIFCCEIACHTMYIATNNINRGCVTGRVPWQGSSPSQRDACVVPDCAYLAWLDRWKSHQHHIKLSTSSRDGRSVNFPHQIVLLYSSADSPRAHAHGAHRATCGVKMQFKRSRRPLAHSTTGNPYVLMAVRGLCCPQNHAAALVAPTTVG